MNYLIQKLLPVPLMLYCINSIVIYASRAARTVSVNAIFFTLGNESMIKSTNLKFDIY